MASFDVATLFRSHQKELQIFLQRRGLSGDVAADITQDTFLRLLTATPGADIIDSRRYLFRTAINLSTDMFRRKALMPLAFDADAALAELSDEAPSQERILISRQELAIMARALDEVPEGPRAVFLARVDGKTLAEISRKMGLPLQTVFSQSLKVTILLRERLAEARKIPA